MDSYQDYKDSGVEWIGEIPSNWSINRSKFIFNNKSNKNFSDEPLLSVTQKDGVVVRSESKMKVWNPADDVSGYKLIESGDFIISLRSFEGGLELSKVRGLVSPAYTVLGTTKKIDDHYFWLLLKSYQFIVELNKHVTGIRQGKNIGWDDFSNIYLACPPLEEQKLISRYLDKKTERIDSLVDKIQKKVALLKEQRTALINQCVTKGLDPTVEMKDSGIEWIGEIPKHWEVSRLKHVGSVTLGKMLTPEDKGDMSLFPYLRSVNVQEDELNLTDLNQMWFSEHEISKLSVKKGDILVNEGGQVGRPCLIKDDLENVGFQNSINRVRSTSVSTKYLYLLVISYFGRGYYDSIVHRVSIPHLTKEKLENSIVIFPASNEQSKIVQFVEKKTKLINGLIDKIQSKVALLKEYRQSLISAAVTGKVRITEDML